MIGCLRMTSEAVLPMTLLGLSPKTAKKISAQVKPTQCFVPVDGSTFPKKVKNWPMRIGL